MKKHAAFPPAMALAYLFSVNTIARSNLILEDKSTMVRNFFDEQCILRNNLCQTVFTTAANNLDTV